MSGDRIEIDRDRIAPLLEAEAPYDIPTLRSFMGTVNWLSLFIPHIAAIAAPLWERFRQEAPFIWTKECEIAFRAIK